MAIFEKTIRNKNFDKLLRKLTLTMFQNADSPIRLSAITAGGSQAVFFKVNTLGEESFLDDIKELLEEILEE